MARAKKKRGEVIAKIIDRKTREHVGFLYEWNNGERQNAWFEKAKDDYFFEELPNEKDDDEKG